MKAEQRPRKVKGRKAWAVVNERGVFCCALPTKLEAIDCIARPSERVIPVLITAAPTRVRGRRGK